MAAYSRRVVQVPSRIEYFLPAESNWAEVEKLLGAMRNEVASGADDAVWTRTTEDELIFWFNERPTSSTFDASHGAYFAMRVNPNHVLGDADISLHKQGDDGVQIRIQDHSNRTRWTMGVLSKENIDLLIDKLSEIRDFSND